MIMKADGEITGEFEISEEEDEHSHRIKILDQNSSSALLELDSWIDWLFSLPWLSLVRKSKKIRARKEKNKDEERKKNEEQLREKSLILKLALQNSKFYFCTK